jgi:aminomethyltransferase
LNKGPFIGRKALAAERKSRSTWAFVGLEIDWLRLEQLFAAVDLPPMVTGRASREAVPVFRKGGVQIGQATSSTFSPILKKYIALATVDSAFAVPGTVVDVEITVEYVRHRASAKVVKLPFFDPPRKRAV